MDTAVQAIARQRYPSSFSSLQRSTAGGVGSSCQDCAVPVEPLALEVCLFENSGRSSSSSPPLASSSSASCLLGCGTMVLTPVIIAGNSGGEGPPNSRNGQETPYQPLGGTIRPFGGAGFRAREQTASTAGGGESAIPMDDVQQEAQSSSSREVMLFEPGSGKRIASVSLGVAFSLHPSRSNGGVLPSSGSPRVTDSAIQLRELLPKVRRFCLRERAATTHSLRLVPVLTISTIIPTVRNAFGVLPATRLY